MRISILAGLALSAAVAAQTQPVVVSPASATTGLGNSNNNIPFSWSPTTYQQVHSAASFSNNNPALFTLMRLRMGDGFANRPGNWVDLDLFVSNSPVDASQASSIFANNVVPATEVNAFVRKQLNLPTLPNNDWSVLIPFDNPYPWTGGHLSWRANNYGNGNGNALFVYPLDAWWSLGPSSRNGTFAGCQSANGTRPATQSVTVFGPGSTARFTGRSYVPTGGLPAVLNLGLRSQNLDLTPFGATGCVLVQDILGSLAGLTNANTNGDVQMTLSIPPDPALSGARFLSQFVFVDGTANPLGLFLSDGFTCTVGTDPLITRVYNTSGPNLASGTVGSEFGMAIGLD